MKTVIAIPVDQSERNQKFLRQLLTSLKKFHPDIETRVFDNPNPLDKDFWYRSAPIIANQLFDEGYERVIKLDADQIVTGSLDEILNDTDDYDVGVVLNDPSWPIQVWDITHPMIFNNGFVVLKSKKFVEHWLGLCYSPHFTNYQYREQDLLTILAGDYGGYKTKILDNNNHVYGEIIKPHWIRARIEDDKIIVDKTQINVIHFGGGNSPDKGNYRIKFQPEVVEYIDKLIK